MYFCDFSPLTFLGASHNVNHHFLNARNSDAVRSNFVQDKEKLEPLTTHVSHGY